MQTDKFLIDFFSFLHFSKWMFLAAIMLVIADLYFGILAAKKRGERIKKSRAIRRTMDKLKSYLIWIILAYTFGQAFLPFGIDLLPLFMLIIVYAVELESIYSNYFSYKGRLLKIDLVKMIKNRIGLEITDDSMDTKRNENNKN